MALNATGVPMTDMAFHTEMEDEQAMKSVLRRLAMPASVLSYDVRVDEDSSGESALWVYLTVDDKTVASNTKKLNELRSFISAMQESALHDGVSRWPYVEFLKSR
ncbi:hypothetical protein U4I36_12635 [Stenotrophomonas maltophilia]|nr:hypothetical protein [Stenotrophomonas maltophilia]MBH1416865.1 hypothetical protein [Stenotrophomonas maltophilia]MBH1812469.1 hypothetical protein [Stenotrophomonas maltophilia]MBH1824615.1 hypothetical protein [Stenotrophomonas maltophilia]MDZ5805061.1 hypothetical protein [Stenotrophomonas maltophilia]HDS1535243.1 hypothetical protein [Stenotrophomonas maltophilia]